MKKEIKIKRVTSNKTILAKLNNEIKIINENIVIRKTEIIMVAGERRINYDIFHN